MNGNLALSRALGDFEFKKSADLSPEQQIVTAFPDVVTHEISPDDEFLVIACDGKPIALIVNRIRSNISKKASGTVSRRKRSLSLSDAVLLQSKSSTGSPRI